MAVIVGRTREGKPNSDTGGDFALVFGSAAQFELHEEGCSNKPMT